MMLYTKNIKVIIIITLIVAISFSFYFSAFAENISLYGSVTDQTPQVNILMGLLPNEQEFKIGMQYIVVRYGDYNYRLFYARDLSSDPVRYIDYSRYNISGYNYDWRILRGETIHPVLNTNNYTYVSNTQGGIYKAVESYFSDKFVVWLLPVVSVILIFYALRPKRGIRV